MEFTLIKSILTRQKKRAPIKIEFQNINIDFSCFFFLIDIRWINISIMSTSIIINFLTLEAN